MAESFRDRMARRQKEFLDGTEEAAAVEDPQVEGPGFFSRAASRVGEAFSRNNPIEITAGLLGGAARRGAAGLGAAKDFAAEQGGVATRAFSEAFSPQEAQAAEVDLAEPPPPRPQTPAAGATNLTDRMLLDANVDLNALSDPGNAAGRMMGLRRDLGVVRQAPGETRAQADRNEILARQVGGDPRNLRPTSVPGIFQTIGENGEPVFVGSSRRAVQESEGQSDIARALGQQSEAATRAQYEQGLRRAYNTERHLARLRGEEMDETLYDFRQRFEPEDAQDPLAGASLEQRQRAAGTAKTIADTRRAVGQEQRAWAEAERKARTDQRANLTSNQQQLEQLIPDSGDEEFAATYRAQLARDFGDDFINRPDAARAVVNAHRALSNDINNPRAGWDWFTSLFDDDIRVTGTDDLYQTINRAAEIALAQDEEGRIKGVKVGQRFTSPSVVRRLATAAMQIATGEQRAALQRLLQQYNASRAE